MILELFNEYRVLAQHIASVLLALAIWRWGAGPERWLIGLFVAMMVAPVYLFRALGLGNFHFGPFAWLSVGIDVLALVAFVLVALYANRNYPLWIAGLQLVAIGAHGVRGMIDTISPLAYLLLSVGPAYCQLLLIFGGFLRHVRRRKRFGTYRDWRVTRDRRPLFQT
ncbi:MAG TPA: hypothetical protein VK913_11515 [Erythrobacter sp.]|nr:hypothetical protein [Erythrobacter sp.]